jgi:RHS repeat-associated protein
VGKQGANYTQFVYDDDGHLQGEYNQASQQIQETLWLGDTPVAVLKLRAGAANGSAIGGGSATSWQGLTAGGVEAFWIEPDQLDSPRAIVNQAHQLVWQWDSDPFGTTVPAEDPSGLATFTYNARFPGQYFDVETRTHYNYFRNYEPLTGRYAENDPIGLGDGPNGYTYVRNRPTSAFDFEGLAFTPKQPYKRPPNSTTPEQRKKVQGKPCHECGAITPKQRADHPTPLVQEYFETGTIDIARMRDPHIVRPHCPTCSNKQGGFMAAYSKRMWKLVCGGED